MTDTLPEPLRREAALNKQADIFSAFGVKTEGPNARIGRSSFQTEAEKLRARVAELEAKLAEAGKDADGYLIDAVAWKGFIRDYGRYVDGDSSMPFATLRDSLAAVVHSADAIAPKEPT